MAEITVTKENFENEVVNSSVPVLVDFWATWCGPCRMIAGVLEELAEKYDGKIKVCKVNVDEQSELSNRFGVMAIPTLLCFEKGELKNKGVGYMELEEIEKLMGL